MKMSTKKIRKINILILTIVLSVMILSLIDIRSVAALVEEGVYTNPVPPGYTFIDFEEGTEGEVIISTIPGLHFTTTEGYDWVYGDVRTGRYNARSLTDPSYNFGTYVLNGYFFAWLGPYMGQGRIDFTLGTASYFSVLTSTGSGLMIEAYDAADNLIDTSGWASGNLNTYTFTRLTVEAESIAYVIIHDTGNFWLIDDLVTDAPTSPSKFLNLPYRDTGIKIQWAWLRQDLSVHSAIDYIKGELDHLSNWCHYYG